MAESAVGDDLAAVILAIVSGNEVPSATRVIPATDGFKLITQPRTVATSPTIVVIIPMSASETMNAAQPPQISVGGVNAPKIFQNIEQKCQTALEQLTSSTIKLSSSIVGPRTQAFKNY